MTNAAPLTTELLDVLETLHRVGASLLWARREPTRMFAAKAHVRSWLTYQAPTLIEAIKGALAMTFTPAAYFSMMAAMGKEASPWSVDEFRATYKRNPKKYDDLIEAYVPIAPRAKCEALTHLAAGVNQCAAGGMELLQVFQEAAIEPAYVATVRNGHGHTFFAKSDSLGEAISHAIFCATCLGTRPGPEHIPAPSEDAEFVVRGDYVCDSNGRFE